MTFHTEWLLGVSSWALDVTEQLKFRAGGKCGDMNINKGMVFIYSGDNGTQQLCQKAS